MKYESYEKLINAKVTELSDPSRLLDFFGKAFIDILNQAMADPDIDGKQYYKLSNKCWDASKEMRDTYFRG